MVQVSKKSLGARSRGYKVKWVQGQLGAENNLFQGQVGASVSGYKFELLQNKVGTVVNGLAIEWVQSQIVKTWKVN